MSRTLAFSTVAESVNEDAVGERSEGEVPWDVGMASESGAGGPTTPLRLDLSSPTSSLPLPASALQVQGLVGKQDHAHGNTHRAPLSSAFLVIQPSTRNLVLCRSSLQSFHRRFQEQAFCPPSSSPRTTKISPHFSSPLPNENQDTFISHEALEQTSRSSFARSSTSTASSSAGSRLRTRWRKRRTWDWEGMGWE